MIKVICGKCKKELNIPGALIFSPVDLLACYKWHICTDCYPGLCDWLEGKLDGKESEEK